MVDEVRRLSDELARDPGSRVFVPLGEALRRQGQLDLALKFTLRGLERHPHFADGHDLLARISIDRGDLEKAFDEWDMVLRLAPGHLGALKGMGFVCFQQGRLAQAEEYLTRAQQTLQAETESARQQLRQRRGDVSLLAAYYIDVFNREFKRHVRGASPEAQPRHAALCGDQEIRLRNA